MNVLDKYAGARGARILLTGILGLASSLTACRDSEPDSDGWGGSDAETTTHVPATVTTTLSSTSSDETTGIGGAGAGGSAQVAGGEILGQPCSADAECGPLTCFEATPVTLDGAGPQGGMCTKTCVWDDDCPEGAHCIDFGGGSYCSLACAHGPDVSPSMKCRGRDDMACGSIIGGAACFPTCASDSACGAGLFCDSGAGLCRLAPPAGDPMGAPCDPNGADTCEGFCACANEVCLEGVCSGFCALGAPGACGEAEGKGACLLGWGPGAGEGDLGACLGYCTCDADCGPPFVCNELSIATAHGFNGICYEDLGGETHPACCDCDGKTCGDDGCGGQCGACLPGEVCSASGQCE